MIHKIFFIFSILFFFVVTSSEADIAKVDTNATIKDQELMWVDQQIAAILPPRLGIANEAIDTIKSPFKLEETVTFTPEGLAIAKPKPIPLRVTLIINSQALINGRWYVKNDTIEGYHISSITRNYVTLANKKETKILTLNKNDSDLKIYTK